MSLTPRLLLALECTVCLQLMDNESQMMGRIERVKQWYEGRQADYSVCLNCSQEVGNPKEKNYRRRFRAKVRRLLGVDKSPSIV